MFRLKWECNLLVQRGVHRRLPVRAIHTQVRAVGKQVRGVAEVTNGVGVDQGLVPARTRAGTRPAPAGIPVVVHGAVLPPGTSSA